jgi:oxaloacetate decarboxylase alpha subunit/pyruvate carboxylase subunit B
MDDLVLYAIYPVTGKKFLQWKYGKEEAPESVKPITLEQVKKREALVKKALAGELVEKKALPALSDKARKFNVCVDNENFEVAVDEIGGTPLIAYAQQLAAQMPAGMPAMPMAAPAMPAAPTAPAAEAAPTPAPEAKAEPAPAAKAAPAEVEGTALKAPMPGMIVKFEKNVGDTVSSGETVVILEAMKMENALPSPAGGTISAINYSSGDSVAKNDVLCVIS